MKLCTDCKHYEAESPRESFCTRPTGVSPVDGKVLRERKWAAIERDGGFWEAIFRDFCGKSGRYWEAKQ